MNGRHASDDAASQNDQREIAVHLDVELIACIDARRGDATRSQYIEQVLAVAMQRITPHLAEEHTVVSANRAELHTHAPGRWRRAS